MIAADSLKRIAVWSLELTERESEVARAGIIEKPFKANEFICMRGDNFEYWTGVVTGLVKIGTMSHAGKAVTFTGLTAGAWFGEGSVLKNEARRYDANARADNRPLRQTVTSFSNACRASPAFPSHIRCKGISWPVLFCAGARF